jgi:hypothetical protein
MQAAILKEKWIVWELTSHGTLTFQYKIFELLNSCLYTQSYASMRLSISRKNLLVNGEKVLRFLIRDGTACKAKQNHVTFLCHYHVLSKQQEYK